MGNVEEEIWGDEFEAAGPSGVANSLFNVGVCYFVTFAVTYYTSWISGVAELVGSRYGQGDIALLVMTGEGGVDFEGLAGEG